MSWSGKRHFKVGQFPHQRKMWVRLEQLHDDEPDRLRWSVGGQLGFDRYHELASMGARDKYNMTPAVMVEQHSKTSIYNALRMVNSLIDEFEKHQGEKEHEKTL